MYEYSYLNHYYDLKKFKLFFINSCPLQPKYEAYKVWAAWIIEERSFHKQVDFFLPHTINENCLPQQLMNVLVEKGTPKQTSEDFVRRITHEANLLIKLHLYLYLSGFHRDLSIKPLIEHHQQVVTVNYQSIKYTLSQTQFYKLKSYYKGNHIELFPYHLWTMMNNYYLLDGHSYQWAIPDKILKVLSQYMKVKAELFASPINSYYNNYFSLFKEDVIFGSLGNFFNIYPDFFLEGTYQVNPPFINRVFIETYNRLLFYLERSQKLNKGLLFILFMPNWLDSKAYRMVKSSHYYCSETIMDAEDHYYYSYKECKYIKAQFSTHILILGTERAKNWFSPNIQHNVVNIFKNPVL
jgi:hypothetical protein